MWLTCLVVCVVLQSVGQQWLSDLSEAWTHVWDESDPAEALRKEEVGGH